MILFYCCPVCGKNKGDLAGYCDYCESVLVKAKCNWCSCLFGTWLCRYLSDYREWAPLDNYCQGCGRIRRDALASCPIKKPSYWRNLHKKLKNFGKRYCSYCEEARWDCSFCARCGNKVVKEYK